MTSSRYSAAIKQKSHNFGVAEHVLPGHVVMSKELSQLLNTRDLSLIEIQNVSHKPTDIQGIILHPFGDTEQKVIKKSGRFYRASSGIAHLNLKFVIL